MTRVKGYYDKVDFRTRHIVESLDMLIAWARARRDGVLEVLQDDSTAISIVNRLNQQVLDLLAAREKVIDASHRFEYERDRINQPD
jgi:hypothetical protein